MIEKRIEKEEEDEEENIKVSVDPILFFIPNLFNLGPNRIINFQIKFKLAGKQNIMIDK